MPVSFQTRYHKKYNVLLGCITIPKQSTASPGIELLELLALGSSSENVDYRKLSPFESPIGELDTSDDASPIATDDEVIVSLQDGGDIWDN